MDSTELSTLFSFRYSMEQATFYISTVVSGDLLSFHGWFFDNGLRTCCFISRCPPQPTEHSVFSLLFSLLFSGVARYSDIGSAIGVLKVGLGKCKMDRYPEDKIAKWRLLCWSHDWAGGTVHGGSRMISSVCSSVLRTYRSLGMGMYSLFRFLYSFDSMYLSLASNGIGFFLSFSRLLEVNVQYPVQAKLEVPCSNPGLDGLLL